MTKQSVMHFVIESARLDSFVITVNGGGISGLGAALVHGYRSGGILSGVGQMFTVAITGVCRAVQV
jgi:hypothetical protein